jgi:hypothetical protein
VSERSDFALGGGESAGRLLAEKAATMVLADAAGR